MRLVALALFAILATGCRNSPQVTAPAPGVPIHLIVEDLARVTYAQMSHHDGIFAPEEVTGHLEGQITGVQDQWGGQVYALGYVLAEEPLTMVFAPMNGGRILPAEGGEVGRVEFQTAHGEVLCWATQLPGGGLAFQTNLRGGHMANIPRHAEGARAFHAVFSTRAKRAE